MNTCSLVGHLLQNASVRGGKNRVLAFALETKQPGNSPEKDDVVCHVPVVLFNPSPELERALTAQGKGALVALQGRIQTTRYESPSGEARSATEVIAYTKSLVVLIATPPHENGEALAA